MQMCPQNLLFVLLLLSLHALSSHSIQTSLIPTSHQISSFQSHHNVFNVDHFGAKGKEEDDRKPNFNSSITNSIRSFKYAFMNAWKEACSSPSHAIYLVPKKKYTLKPLSFNGPCKSKMTIMILGTLAASSKQSDWDEDDTSHWILFNKVKNLNIEGGGTIVGNGEIWWKNSCKVNPNLPCTIAPTALTFYGCNQLTVDNLTLVNSQQMHLSVEQCNNVSIINVAISAPKESPNTDGIHISNTMNMLIKGCVIKTGDDCISIVSGSNNILVSDIACGPGHGISIGSLGENNSIAKVSDVVVEKVRLKDTTNGVRIKSWQGGKGHAKNIIFQNIIMENVYNPIIIDQSYCDSLYPCNEEKSAVSISQVTYRNIKGTSASRVAVNFNCSKSHPCQKIAMENIRLVGNGGESTESLCRNAKLERSDAVLPTCVKES